MQTTQLTTCLRPIAYPPRLVPFSTTTGKEPRSQNRVLPDILLDSQILRFGNQTLVTKALCHIQHSLNNDMATRQVLPHSLELPRSHGPLFEIIDDQALQGERLAHEVEGDCGGEHFDAGYEFALARRCEAEPVERGHVVAVDVGLQVGHGAVVRAFRVCVEPLDDGVDGGWAGPALSVE